MSPDNIKEFIWTHRLEDPQRVALSARKHPDLPMAFIAGQIDFLQKIQKKVPSWYREGLKFPAAISMEQASSEATARFKASLLPGGKMADLSGGLGVDSFFFSKFFSSVTYVEPNAELANITAHNFGVLGVGNAQFIHASAEDFLRGSSETFDLLYLDPSRRHQQKGKVFQLQDCSPNILDIKALALGKAPKVLLKTAPLLDISLAARQLEQVSQIWVVASGDECREVLYLLERSPTLFPEIAVHAVQLNKDGAVQDFQFSYGEEQQAPVEYALPQQYLYEPNPAILKAGGFRSFACRYGLKKLQQHTHLYTSEQFVPGLPARSFAIEAVCKYERKAVQACIPSGKANITTRHFPDNAEAVRKKLGLADGGDTYVFALTDMEQRKVLVVGKKI
ncbi:MAG: hypothetical protein IT262_06480 [Saprospiraceae bacterium]|nr:hypothetical protein [Saprospiraceae bacterium]